ncbi:MAG: peptide chain release factor 1 [bacterium]|nr:peptide chain release factor 1 [Planctomycetota bacterium]HIL50634.1 peptide chain release factor 1 [Planctomycetota bacterium]
MEFAAPIIDKLRERAAKFDALTELLSQPEVASCGKRLTTLMRERGQLEQSHALCQRMEDLFQREEEAQAILSEETDDEDFLELARADLEAVESEAAGLYDEIKAALVTESDDFRNKVIMEIRAGAGGDEATLFAADLARMYQRFFETKHWKVEDLEVNPSDVGGYKEITLGIEGEGAWRLLRHESGGHRVQRVPSTESQGRIHTSAATVAVLPEAEEAEIDVRDEDLRIDTMRAGGPGGQSVNKTSSAVRITHLPTNTVVQCQDEKSQHKNKAKALRILKSRLLEAEHRRLHEERAASRKSQVGSGDRSTRIRTYNWPQNRISDHRLDQNHSLEQVVAGKLAPLLEALDLRDREERIRNL